MLGKVLLFPFVLIARAVRIGFGGICEALLMAMGAALIHVGIGLLMGHNDWTTRFVEAALIGAAAGICYGVYAAFRQPPAPPTPAAFRPRFLARLLRGAQHACLAVGKLVVVVLFLGLFVVCAAISWGTPRVTPDAPPSAEAAAPAGQPAGADQVAPADPAFVLQTPPALMASLAKVYADSRFPDMYTARAVFQAGDRPVADYRVRFRLSDFAADWGPWSNSAQVEAHHAATAPYFPILDQDRLARLDGPGVADLEAEYEYRADDGRTVHKVEGRRLKVFARNTMMLIRAPQSEEQNQARIADPNLYWPQLDANAQMELPALVTKDDPVILQVAGWVSGQTAGEPAMSDADARAFLGALFDFMVANGIRYQTPPVEVAEGWETQHVKFGRDVLRNRAGTCIDLAVFYASVCEAVGLRPVLFVVPGHCFPAIRMPQSGELVGVETTSVGFSRLQDGPATLASSYPFAALIGTEEIRKALAGPHSLVDVAAGRQAGVQSLQLEPLPADVLTRWEIKPVPPTPAWLTLAYWGAVVGGLFAAQRWLQRRRLARHLRSAEPWVRFQAIGALSRMTDSHASAMLLQALRDADENVRSAAAAALRSRAEATPADSDQDCRPAPRDIDTPSIVGPIVAASGEHMIAPPLTVGVGVLAVE